MKTDSVKEKSLHPATAPATHKQVHKEESRDELDERILAALNAAADKKAIDLVVLDLREVASFTDYFVIASGANERQVQAIADAVQETLKAEGSNAARIEGYKTAEWILLDYGDFVVHVFDDKSRKFFDLERLWRESKRVPLPPEVVGVSSLRNDS